jgi:hypothetical protein
MEYHSLSIRVPRKTWEDLKKYQRERPHFNLNSIVIEALCRYLAEGGEPLSPMPAKGKK